jgi:serine acetyltransferase
VRHVRRLALKLRIFYLRWIWKMDIHPTARLSMSAHLDKGFGPGIHIGERSYVAFGATVMTRDSVDGANRHTYVGDGCFIGARSILLPGITVGDGCVIGAGAVVTMDVPHGCIVAGNPGRIIRRDIKVLRYGRSPDAARTAELLWQKGDHPLA